MKRLTTMELIRENLAFMRLAITLLALSIATGGILYFGGLAFLHYAEDRATAANQRYESARDRYARSEAENEEIRIYLAPYQTLTAAGQTGEERRLEWVDALGRLREQHKLYPIEYDIGSRHPYTFPAGPATDALSVSASRMSLRFGLLHEGDLLTLLNGLQKESRNFYVLDRCTLERTSPDPAPQQAENLHGECTLDWLSFRPAGDEETQP